MFRRVEQGLVLDHPDPTWPDDLDQLGYYVTEEGLIRMKDQPERRFNFHITNHERHNEKHREAMQKWVRREVYSRMSKQGIERLYLPQLSYEKPQEPAIPILATSKEVLNTRKRVLVVINDDFQDLGILAYRVLYEEGGLDGGSCVEVCKEMRGRSPGSAEKTSEEPADNPLNADAPGVIILNPGQLRYSHKFNEAMSLQSWFAMPRKSIAHPPVAFNGEHNTVAGHKTVAEHIQSVLDQVVLNAEFVSPEAEVYVVGIKRGAEDLLEVLDNNWPKYSGRLTGLALMSPPNVWGPTNTDFKDFLLHRARAWVCSDQPANVVVSVPEQVAPLNSAVFEVAKVSENDKAGNSASGSTKEKISWLQEAPKKGISRQEVREMIGFQRLKSYVRYVEGEGLASAIASLASSCLSFREERTTNSCAQPTSPSADEQANAAKQHLSDTYRRGPDTPATKNVRTDEILYPMFSGGDPEISEVLFINVYKNVLSFFEEIAANPTYKNPIFALAPAAVKAQAEARAPLPESTADPFEVPDVMANLQINDAPRFEPLQETNPKKEQGDKGVADKAEDDGAKDGSKVEFAGSLIDVGLLEKAGLKVDTEKDKENVPS